MGKDKLIPGDIEPSTGLPFCHASATREEEKILHSIGVRDPGNASEKPITIAFATAMRLSGMTPGCPFCIYWKDIEGSHDWGRCDFLQRVTYKEDCCVDFKDDGSGYSKIL